MTEGEFVRSVRRFCTKLMVATILRLTYCSAHVARLAVTGGKDTLAEEENTGQVMV